LAVLGFQMLLLLFMLSAALGLVQSLFLQARSRCFCSAASVALLQMIRAMARIQMPAATGQQTIL